MSEFVKGNLVHWENGPSNNIGVVRDLSPRQITVFFDRGKQQTFVLKKQVQIWKISPLMKIISIHSPHRQ